MRTLGKKSCVVLCFVLMALTMPISEAAGATPEQIKASIEKGVEWLVAQQDPNGSWWDDWAWESIAPTGFAVVKLEDRAFELGFKSPFDPNYPYKDAVKAGLDYIFQNAVVVDINVQPAGNPDSDGDGKGVYLGNEWYTTYSTGICMMAIAASRDPNRVVNVPGSQVNGWTYKEVLQDMVDYMAFGQSDIDSNGRGGWGYSDNEGWSDNSNGGYAVLGLAYAQDQQLGFNCTIPQFVRNELSLFVDWIQCNSGDDWDGGSGYSWPCDWVNILKTGNLIFEMKFAGDTTAPPPARMQRALAYLGRWWNEPNQDPGWKGPPPHYQSMYCVMKGLTYAGIQTIDVNGAPVYWYDEFADAIVANQQPDGSWPQDYWGGQILATEWALLTLEVIAPILNQPPDCSGAQADIGCLWPPNNKMVSVSILGVTDPDGDPVSIIITGITSDEATATEKGAGGAVHAPDAAGVGTDKAQLRAERSGKGNGRVYVVSFIASDGRGGECEGTVKVKVPHDQRPSLKSPAPCEAIDDGQKYDATVIN